jgi:uncharacterized protein HemX
MPKDYIPNDPTRPTFSDDLDRQSRFNDPLRFDPETAGTSGDGAKIGLVAIALALLMGAVFYSVSHSNVNEAANPPSSQTAQNQSGALPQAPPGMRDVTPRRPNTDPGMTTGAAPSQPTPPNK